MSSREVWVVTGASRGIGAEFAVQVQLCSLRERSRPVRISMHALGADYRGPLNVTFVQILARPNTVVIAGARSPEKADALKQLKQSNPERLHVITLDVSATASIQVGAP